MIKTSPQHRMHETGDIIVLPRVSDVRGGAIRDLDIGDLANVVPFRRPKSVQSDAPPCIVDAATRPMVPLHPVRSVKFWAAAATAATMHVAIFAVFMLYEPPPHPSIGVKAISVELMIGSNTPSGVRKAPSLDEVEQKGIDAEVKPDIVDPADGDAKLADRANDFAAVQPGSNEINAAQAKAAEQPVESVAKPVPEAPNGQEAEIEPKPESKVEPKPQSKLEKPVQKPAPKAAEKPEAKHARKKANRDTERTRDRDEESAYRERRNSSNGAGKGQSSGDTDFRSRVLGHLMRFKPLLQDRTIGSVTVHFTLNSSGAVISGPRLVGSSGNAAFDEAAIAMVRRAAPFPQPGPRDDPRIVFPLNFNR